MRQREPSSAPFLQTKKKPAEAGFQDHDDILSLRSLQMVDHP